MVGIYKITNKLNEMSYIGQSIHCGKRFDEHCRGKQQYIDQVISEIGIENFNFEILKQTEKEHLSYWEDYYIMRYNTFLPNGYNKKWNCSKEIRKEIIQKIEKEFHIDQSSYINQNLFISQDLSTFQETSNQDSNSIYFPCEIEILKQLKKADCIYTWLLVHSYYNPDEKYNYIYKEDINFSKISFDICCSRQTASKHFKELILNNFIHEDKYNGKKCYIILNKGKYKMIKKETAIVLYNNEELIKTYIFLLNKQEIFLNEGKKSFPCSVKEILLGLGHSASHKSSYNKMRENILILEKSNLIQYKNISKTQKEDGTWRPAYMEVYEVNKKASDEWLGKTEKEWEKEDSNK